MATKKSPLRKENAGVLHTGVIFNDGLLRDLSARFFRRARLWAHVSDQAA